MLGVGPSSRRTHRPADRIWVHPAADILKTEQELDGGSRRLSPRNGVRTPDRLVMFSLNTMDYPMFFLSLSTGC